jgi:hypothetical protein
MKRHHRAACRGPWCAPVPRRLVCQRQSHCDLIGIIHLCCWEARGQEVAGVWQVIALVSSASLQEL